MLKIENNDLNLNNVRDVIQGKEVVIKLLQCATLADVDKGRTYTKQEVKAIFLL